MQKVFQYSLINVETDEVAVDHHRDGEFVLTASSISDLLSEIGDYFDLGNAHKFLKPDGTMDIEREIHTDDGINYETEVTKYKIVKEEVIEVQFSPDDLEDIESIISGDDDFDDN